MLIRVHLRLASAQRTLKLYGLRHEAGCFRVTKLDQVFEHADNRAASYPERGQAPRDCQLCAGSIGSPRSQSVFG